MKYNRPAKAVNVEGMGTIYIRALSVGDLRKVGDTSLPEDERAKLLLWCVVDENGNQKFGDPSELDDMPVDIYLDMQKAIFSVNLPSLADLKKS